MPTGAPCCATTPPQQRSDPRGSVVEYPDRHGQAWQLIWGGGDWWAPRRRLVVPLSACPETFREAVHKRPEKVCTVGYPLARATSDKDGPQVMPALLLPASFTISGDALVVDLTAAVPTLNPGWLRTAARASSSWKAGALTEALFPEGEDDDLGSVVGRLRHALATQGGGALKPGDLLAEVVLEGAGLCNAAALFLPSDARFTQGAERDLDAVRAGMVGRDARRHSAQHHAARRRPGRRAGGDRRADQRAAADTASVRPPRATRSGRRSRSSRGRRGRARARSSWH